MERRAPYVAHSDARGRFRGLTRETWAEANFIETGAGQVRGNHYHAETRELFFIVRRWRNLVVAIAAAGVLLSIVAGMQQPNYYSATALMLVEHRENRVVDFRDGSSALTVAARVTGKG